MTYTVKNGTWCKDNGKEYYSTTKAGLKAALKSEQAIQNTRLNNIENAAANKEITPLEIQQI